MNIVLLMIAALVTCGCIWRAVENQRECHRKATVNKVDEKQTRESYGGAHRILREAEAIWPENEEQAREVAERNTGIMMQTMRELGCQPEKDKDNPYTFSVIYQGETFTFFCANPYIRIYDLGWSRIDVKDPEYPAINEAMNAVNFDAGPTVVMTNADETGHRFFHSHSSFLLHPGFSQNTEFIKGQLSAFFSVKEDIRNTFHKLIAEQQEMSKKRKPVGFTTGADADTEDKTA